MEDIFFYNWEDGTIETAEQLLGGRERLGYWLLFGVLVTAVTAMLIVALHF